jgi:hypothetical protein
MHHRPNIITTIIRYNKDGGRIFQRPIPHLENIPQTKNRNTFTMTGIVS